jgi:diadenosine tetraphosphate (Ap4A) HIT family hydrolase
MLYKDYIKTVTECPFCKRQEIFTENKSAYITYAIAPYHEGHLLVVPKRHIIDIEDVSLVERNDIDDLIVQGVVVLKKAGYEHLSVLVRDGRTDVEKGNKSVDHLHYHIVPNIRIGDLDHVGKEREILEGESLNSAVDRFHSLFS